MELKSVVSFEQNGKRLAVYKSELRYHICSNMWTGTALTCVSLERALDIYNVCLVMLVGNKFLN